LTTASNSPVPPSQPAKPPYPLAFRIRRNTAVISRWLHIYLSMASFTIVLFFGATGITLNHPDWFPGHPQTAHYTSTMPTALLAAKPPDKLGIVEHLRTAHKITGAVSDFRVDDAQISVSFKGPGYTADAFIDPATGRYDLDETRSGFIAVINDLHKGRDTGKVWSVVIDASAIFLCLVSLTGLILMWFIHKRRTAGFILAAIGTALGYFLYRLYVP
jgi:uncharacterized protein